LLSQVQNGGIEKTEKRSAQNTPARHFPGCPLFFRFLPGRRRRVSLDPGSPVFVKKRLVFFIKL